MRRKNERNSIVILVLLIIAVLSLFTFIVSHSQHTGSNLEHDSSAIPMIADSSGNELVVPAFSQLAFKAGEMKQIVMLSNPASNEADMYIVLSVDGNEIYKSGLIKPGECIKEIELNRSLYIGTYNCTVFYRFNKDGVELNGLKNNCKVEVH